MNLLYISPHYPPHYSQFIESLAKHGVKVLGVTDIPDAALDRRVASSLTGHYRVESLQNEEQVMMAADFFKQKFGEITRVESHLEPWLELEAKLRDKHNAVGFKSEEIKFMKRKSLMRDVFVRAKVPCAKGIVIKDMEQCKKFINKKYPVFIKPDIGVGASDTYTIRNEADLISFFEKKSDYDYYMEEYVKGDIESFDGLTDSNGNIVFSTTNIFNNDIHNIVAKNQNVWYYSDRKIPKALEKYGKAIVKEANIREKFFHIEFFKVNGKYQALEINMRPPGGVTTHMFNFACDIDVYDWWASIVSGKDPNRKYERKYLCAFIGRKHDRAYKYSHDYLYEKWGKTIVHSHPMNPIEYLVMGHWGYLVRHESKDQLIKIINDFMLEE
jgi:hypothetical protein